MAKKSFNTAVAKKTPNYKRGADPFIPVKVGKVIPQSRQLTILATSPVHQGRKTRSLASMGSYGTVTTPAGRTFEVALPCEHMVFTKEDGERVCRLNCDEWRDAHGRAA